MAQSNEDLFEIGSKAFEEGAFALATEYFNALTKRNTHNYGHQLNLAVSKFLESGCLSKNDFEDSIFKLAQEVGINVTDAGGNDVQYPAILYNLAVLMFNKNYFSSSFGMAKLLGDKIHSIASLERIWVRARFLYIDLLIKSQEFQIAIEEMDKLEIQMQSLIEQGSNINDLFSTIKAKLQQDRTLCYLSMMSLKNAKREYKNLLAISGSISSHSYSGFCLKAYHDYLRGNPKKAFKTMVNCEQAIDVKENNRHFKSQGDNMRLIYKNNQGCCNFYLRRPTGSMYCFQDALKEVEMYSNSNRLGKFHDVPIYAACKTLRESVVINYNLGITLLHAKKPQEAFKKLNWCLKFYPRNARLWLRVAEACISIHKPENDELTCLTADKCFIQHVQDGLIRKYVLGKSVPKRSVADSQVNAYNTCQKETATLHYAQNCLDNALGLLNSQIKKGSVNVYPSNPITNASEILNLHMSTLSAAAYVALELENYSVAIRRSKELLEIEGISPTFNYLGKSYLAAAYSGFGDGANAVQHMFEPLDCSKIDYCPDYSEKKDDTTNDFGRPQLQVPLSEWMPNAELTATTIREFNQCVTALNMKQFQKANEIFKILEAKFRPHLPPELMKVAMHLYTSLGDYEERKKLLIQNSTTHYFQTFR